ncbi:ferritin-like domain-containing protein [Flavobacterium sp. ANB]|uniref:ferritin-like domain-containing protein n=1 Tax=unclassified Flavobacterium TaxID=196869 RepID=UPI0012B6CB3A|nr:MULTISPECIES: ferritin-like domain-containing protein [unclassified Flavobacterium]MBF4514733.1 ferritin-like domain-containing protein [Flavobacterium sp. ANB]MTD68059.1 ferritin-like domain-containing protein [Flavobacterium sp. LC2016-13]
MKNEVKIHEVDPSLNTRRSFLKLGGLTLVTAGLVVAGCSNNDDDDPVMEDTSLPGVRNGVFDLGSGDFGVLTYAYALEQLEADFYTKVVNASGFNATFNDIERQVLTDLYHHEVIHRDFFKAALSGGLPDPSSQLLPSLAFNYGSLNFNSRNEVLATAKALEDTGVAAYNGAGKLIKTPAYLLLAGKIVSVEARHASAIRSLINPNSSDFAGDDIVDMSSGLDAAKDPSKILPIAGGFITTKFTAKYLP